MFFRFGAALILLVMIALLGIAVEKRNLDLRRAVSQQDFRQEILLEEHAQHRLKAQLLGAPSRLLEERPKFQAIPGNSTKKQNGPRATRPVRSIPAAMLDEDLPTH